MHNGADTVSSKGEVRIEQILRKEHIRFEREKTFKDLRGGLYRFDFYLTDLGVILEYQGMQHYEYVKLFHKKRSDFTKAQGRDRRKISYCLAHKIPLYCIPFWELENLNTLNDLLKDEFLARDKFHNDNVYRLQKSRIKT